MRGAENQVVILKLNQKCYKNTVGQTSNLHTFSKTNEDLKYLFISLLIDFKIENRALI